MEADLVRMALRGIALAILATRQVHGMDPLNLRAIVSNDATFAAWLVAVFLVGSFDAFAGGILAAVTIVHQAA